MAREAWKVQLDLPRKATFYRALSLMFNSGLQLMNALEALADTADEDFSLVILELCTKLEQGQTLHHAMAQYPRAFSKFDVSLVEIGFETGSITRVLQRLAEISEKNNETQQKVRSALIYPIFLMVACILMALIVPPLLFRGLFDFLISLDVGLPFITRLVAGFSHSLSNPAVSGSLCIAVVLITILIQQLSTNPDSRVIVFEAIHKTPAFGEVWEGLAVGRFSFGLALMMETGFPLHQALPLAIKSTDDPYFESRTKSAVQSVIEGKYLSDSLKETEAFPDIVIQAIRVGEESGDTVKMIRHAATLIEGDLERKVDACVAMLEPLSLLIMGLLVGTTAVAALLPLAKIVQGL